MTFHLLNQHGLPCNRVRACIAGRATRNCWFSNLLGAFSLLLFAFVLCPLIAPLCSPIAAPCSLPSAFCFLLCVLEITARMSHNWTAQCSCVSPCDETSSLFRVETCMLPSCASLHSTRDAKIVDFKYHDVDVVPCQLTQFRGTNKDLCIRVSSRPHVALQILDCICWS